MKTKRWAVCVVLASVAWLVPSVHADQPSAQPANVVQPSAVAGQSATVAIHPANASNPAAANNPANASNPANAINPAAAGRLNVIVICVDGLSAGMLGYEGNAGNAMVKTPQLDRLASQSVRFARAYTASPQSAASQMSILTGQYPHAHGVINENATLSSRATAFTETFAKSGYACGLVGSWKLKLEATPPLSATAPPPGIPSSPSTAPAANALPPTSSAPALPASTPAAPAASSPASASAPIPNTMPSSAPVTPPSSPVPAAPPPSSAPAVPPPSSPPPAPVTPPPPPKAVAPGLGFSFYAVSDPASPMQNAPANVNGQPTTAAGYLPDWLTDQAIEFVRQSSAGKKPFCVCLFFPPVREPMSYPPGMEDSYPPASLPMPAAKPVPTLPSRLSNCDPVQNYRNKPGDQLRQSLSKYNAAISRMDQNVGRLLDVLSQLQLDHNTIVVFTSSQGFATGENSLWGTGPLLREPFIRCPLLIRLPASVSAGAAEASDNNKSFLMRPAAIQPLVSTVDIAPTLLEAAGLSPLLRAQGFSLVKLAREGVDRDRPRECFIESEIVNGQSYPARAVIVDPYKLIDYGQEADAKDQFYKLTDDANEEKNLVADSVYAPVVKAMRARLDSWRKHTGDKK